jgi:hypothetical protein
VESAVKACPQVLHRKALAPLENRDRIVDMTGIVEVFHDDQRVIGASVLALLFGATGVDRAVELVV